MGVRGDLQLVERAIRQRWLNDRARELVAAMHIEVLEDDEMDLEIKLKVADQVIKIEAQNQRDEHKIVDVNVSARHAELDAIAADLGIAPGAIRAIAGPSGGSNRGAEGHGGAPGTR